MNEKWRYVRGMAKERVARHAEHLSRHPKDRKAYERMIYAAKGLSDELTGKSYTHDLYKKVYTKR